MIRDIKSFPLVELGENLILAYEEEQNEHVRLAVLAARNRHKLRVRNAVAHAMSSGEEGSDGIEEGLVEGGMEFDEAKEKAKALKTFKAAQHLSICREQVFGDFIRENHLYKELDWFFPQLLSNIFESFQLQRDSDGKISPETVKIDPYKQPELLALKSFATINRRMYFQTAEKGKRAEPHYKSKYNVYVPLVMAAFKRHQDIPYSEWSLEAAKSSCHEELGRYLGSELPVLDVQERLRLRLDSITQISSGKQEDPTWSFKLNGDIKSYARTDNPSDDALYLYSIIQTWCMHPSNWNPLMIKDPINWDDEPERLISPAVLKHQKVPSLRQQESFAAETPPW